MARVLRMPDVAADEDDGVLAAWLVEELATFDAAQTIAYVETESLLLSVEAGRPGVLVKALVEAGDVVDPGTPIGVLADPEEQVGDVDALLERLGIHTGPGPASVRPATRSTEPPDPVAVVEEDGAEGVAEPVPEPVEEDEETVPHMVLRTTVRAEPLLRLHDDVDDPLQGSASVTLGDLVLKLVAAACDAVPELDGSDGKARGFTDVALALPGPGGTVTAVVRDVGSLSLGRLAATTRDLVARAAEGRLDPTEVEGGAIEVTDLAAYGVAELAASVSPPYVAHLAFGTVRDEPVVEQGALVPGKVVTITLSVDHERVDRLVAARWLAAFADLLGRPARALV